MLIKHKVPPSYSRAEDSARSLNGRRDDESSFVSRELPESTSLPRVRRGSFDYVVAFAPTAPEITEGESIHKGEAD